MPTDETGIKILLHTSPKPRILRISHHLILIDIRRKRKILSFPYSFEVVRSAILAVRKLHGDATAMSNGHCRPADMRHRGPPSTGLGLSNGVSWCTDLLILPNIVRIIWIRGRWTSGLSRPICDPIQKELEGPTKDRPAYWNAFARWISLHQQLHNSGDTSNTYNVT